MLILNLLNLLILLTSFIHSHQETDVENGACENEKCSENSLDIGAIDEALNSLDQEDPDLIEAVRKRLVAPPPKTERYVLETDFRLDLDKDKDR